jgi:hypothetical protein
VNEDFELVRTHLIFPFPNIKERKLINFLLAEELVEL